MGLLGFLGGNKGGGTPKYAKKALLKMNQKAEEVAAIPFQPYEAPRVADLSDTTKAGVNALVGQLNSNVGGAAVNSSIDLAKKVGNYTPTQVTPGTMTASLMGTTTLRPVASAQGATVAPVGNVTGATIDRGNVRDVTAGTFTGSDISGYMNPYISNVVQTTLGDLNRQREIQRQTDNAKAVAAGAFGGSRQAVVDAETNRALLDTSARTAADLYKSGYDTASGLLVGDLDRGLNAAQSNQSADLSIVGQNAGYTQAAALANQDVATKRALAEAGYAQEAGLSNQKFDYSAAERDALLAQEAAANNQAAEQEAGKTNYAGLLEAQKANQAAGLTANNTAADAAATLTAAGQTQQQMATAQAEAVTKAGLLQQGVDQSTLDAQYQEFLRKIGYPREQLDVLQSSTGQLVKTEAKPQTGLFDVAGKGLAAYGSAVSGGLFGGK